jgi:hypothetical protein
VFEKIEARLWNQANSPTSWQAFNTLVQNMRKVNYTRVPVAGIMTMLVAAKLSFRPITITGAGSVQLHLQFTHAR